ncbi:uncharacterized protein LY89DRAFT_680251 [Mollisia scopiformis]|uniref:Uncharacterized protein n=1 Tax=Mollisia scopiformis TaxID=149040 RepID=A0A194XTH2_MOLSC|nr:uncharacterized protein LY89DRAFT_680251 [Mollisia scopiformis]KUJ23508.1 hypothetical protein LY89DRAFT_680251 [Mollisia scopiformis]
MWSARSANDGYMLRALRLGTHLLFYLSSLTDWNHPHAFMGQHMPSMFSSQPGGHTT